MPYNVGVCDGRGLGVLVKAARPTSATSCKVSPVTKRFKDNNVNEDTETPPGTNILLAVVGPSPYFIRSRVFRHPLMLHQSSLVSRAVGHFSLTSFSAYTKLSTLIGWLWMWAESAARQCVCEF